MTDTGHVGERLGAYLDAELDARERAAVDAHLRVCGVCRNELAALHAVHDELRLAQVPVPPETYWRRFAARVEERLSVSEPAPTPWTERVSRWFVPSGRFAWARALAAVASVTLLVYVGVRGSRDEAFEGVSAPQLIRRQEPGDSKTQSRPEPLPSRVGIAGESPASPPVVESVDELRVDLARPVAGKPSESLAKGLGEQEARERSAVDGERDALAAAPTFDGVPMQGARGNPDRDEATQQNRAGGLVSPSEELAVGKTKDAPTAKRELALKTPGSADSVSRFDLALGRVQQAEPAAEVRLSAPSLGDASNDVRIFVAAALANDSETARRTRESLARSNPAATDELHHMDTWSHAARSEPARLHSSARVKEETPSAFGPADSTPVALRALDALVWSRRHQPGFREHVARMADALEAASATHPELLPRTRAYLGFLAETATTADGRARWQQRLDALAPE